MRRWPVEWACPASRLGADESGTPVQIPLAAVEPDDLVSIRVSDTFSIELRTPPTGDATVVQHGRRFLRAWKTVPRFAAVASPDDTVELLQRHGDNQPARHPHGWAITRPDLTEPMHFFRDTTSACGEVVGYAGLCYPRFDPGFFPEGMVLCVACSEAVSS